jgi:hypothetical protein
MHPERRKSVQSLLSGIEHLGDVLDVEMRHSVVLNMDDVRDFTLDSTQRWIDGCCFAGERSDETRCIRGGRYYPAGQLNDI